MNTLVNQGLYLLKHNALALNLYKYVGSAVFNLLGHIVPIDDRIVLFSGHSARFNDSPKAIFDYMASTGLAKEYDCVWAVSNPGSYKAPNARFIKADSAEYFLTALRAKYWIAAVNIERGLHFKKKETKYLNTWHSAHITYVGNAVGIRNDYDWSNVDYVCCSGDYEKDIFVKDFNATRESFLECGLPRNDRLYNATEDERLRIRAEMGISEETLVLLYAPTWRDSTDGGKSYSMKPPIDWYGVKKRLASKKILVLTRAHGYTTSLVTERPDLVIDCSDYPDVNDLLLVADVLITDYSGIAMDYAITEKPFCCFGYDYDEYKLTRGFYFDIEEEYPGGVLRTEEELLDYLENLDFDTARQEVRALKNRRLNYGGDAARTCCETLFESGPK